MNNKIKIDKYKPQNIDEIVGNKYSKTLLNYISNSKYNFLPHMIFYGPENTCKKTSFLLLIIKKYGYNILNKILYFNIYDYLEYGSKYISENYTISKNIKEKYNYQESLLFNFKNIIKEYCSTQSLNDYNNKIILLDNTEYLTFEMQYSLRRVIEKSKNICVFIFITNNIFKLIEPIKSRCLLMPFNSIELKSIIKYILKKNNYDNNYKSLIFKFAVENNEIIDKTIIDFEKYKITLSEDNNKIIDQKIFYENTNLIKYFIEMINKDDINEIIKDIKKILLTEKNLLNDIIIQLIQKINMRIIYNKDTKTEELMKYMMNFIILLGKYDLKIKLSNDNYIELINLILDIKKNKYYYNIARDRFELSIYGL